MTQFPGKKIVFRNLGWSGDTVFGQARARFGTVEDGFEHLEVQINSLEPTVIIVGYGANESTAGVAGRESFQSGLDRLLNTLSATGARIVLCSPIQHEKLGAPLPDPTTNNVHRHLYRESIRQLAHDGHGFIDLFQPDADIDSPGHHWTYNGIHLSSFGYYKVGSQVAQQLLERPSWSLDLDVAHQVYDAQGVKIDALKWEDGHWEVKLTSLQLPYVYDHEPGELAAVQTDGEGGRMFAFAV